VRSGIPKKRWETAEPRTRSAWSAARHKRRASINLGFLRTQAERINRRLAYVWPTDSRRERAMFEKLKEAYVKARYSKHYRISEDELSWLGERVEELGSVVQTICMERIESLARSAAA
jgi:uncharacterized protein